MTQKIHSIKVEGYECYRCGHKWVPDKKDKIPKQCPSCHRVTWHQKRMRI